MENKRICKCGATLIPKKKWFKDVIVYKCPHSNIFNKKEHSVSKAYYMKAKAYNMKTNLWQ